MRKYSKHIIRDVKHNLSTLFPMVTASYDTMRGNIGIKKLTGDFYNCYIGKELVLPHATLAEALQFYYVHRFDCELTTRDVNDLAWLAQA